ncbi:MAG: DNA alkylation repair protein [Bacteroidota bacterium]
MHLDPEILQRKGARKIEDIPQNVLQLLNEGIIETVNLTEWLAADQLKLLKIILKDLKQEDWYPIIEKEVLAQKKRTANSDCKIIGQQFSALLDDPHRINQLSQHPSDFVRSWACWAISHRIQDLEQLAQEMKIFAADAHFGLREVVIFASKDKFAAELDKSLVILGPWAQSSDENIRRYLVEMLRPIGVWTKKIPALVADPAPMLPILESLKSDTSK